MALAVDFQTIIEMFDKVTTMFEHELRPLLMHKVDGNYRGISFHEVRSTTERFACGLASLGVKQGDMVGLISENRPEWVVADIGMMSLGAVSVPLYPTMTPKQIEFIFNDAGVKFAVVSNQMQLNKLLKIAGEVKTLETIIVMNATGVAEDGRVRKFASLLAPALEHSGIHEAAKRIKPEDVLTVIYTSGTTGEPRGVTLTHNNMASNIRLSAPCLPISKEDVLLSFLPLCHSFERMGGYYTAMACGATIAYAESIETVRENLLEVRPTVITTVPRLFERMYNRIQKQVDTQHPLKQKMFRWAIEVGKKYARARRNGSASPLLSLQRTMAERLVFRGLKRRTGGKIRFFISGGAALAKEFGEFYEAIGLQIIEGYGLTESSPVISVNRIDDYKFGTVGKPVPGVEVSIAGDGEILARGPNIMKGYWNNPTATSEVLDKTGWLHTGDVGMFDEEGFLHITDRKKHLFKSSGGKYIAPQHIENLLLQSKYVDQIIVIGEGRPFLTALVVPDFDLMKEFTAKSNSADKLLESEFARLQKDLPAYERVRKFTILDSPLTVEGGEITPTMKVKRRVVEEKYRQIIEKMYV